MSLQSARSSRGFARATWLSLLLLGLLLAAPAPALRAQDLPENDRLDEATQRMREAVQRIVVPPTVLTNGSFVRGAFKDVVTEASSWTVRIKSDGKDVALGAIVTADGHIITKASQLGSQLTCRLHDGRELAADLISQKPEFDLALLKIAAENLPTVVWEDNLLHLGQWLATPGQGKLPTSIGVLSVMEREISKESGFLGIVLEEGEGGPRVSQVMADSGAAAAGVLIDDVVTHCNGVRTENRETLIRNVRNFGPGEDVELTIKRAGKEIKLSAELSRSIQGWRPDRREIQNTMGGKLSERRQGFPIALQHDTVLEPTDCGGVVVDLDGRAVGINVARAGRTETFALPAATVKALLPELLAGKMTSTVQAAPSVDPAIGTSATRPMIPVGTPPEPQE